MTDPVGDFRAAVWAGLGNAPDVISPGRLHRFRTSNRLGDDAGWCKLFDDMRGGVFGCHRRGISEIWRSTEGAGTGYERRVMPGRRAMATCAEREVERRQKWAKSAERNDEMWAECVPVVPGDAVTAYMKRRGFGDMWPLPDTLKLHRALPYWHGPDKLGTFPAMVAPIVSPDGRRVALHRTYLTQEGRKADVPSPKKLTGAAGPLHGACIPLRTPAGGVLGVAEGIETALAACHASGVPTIATYCAGALAGFLWPADVRRLVVFADNDKVGREAAEKLRARAVAARLRCDVLTPTVEGTDWADVWTDREAESPGRRAAL